MLVQDIEDHGVIWELANAAAALAACTAAAAFRPNISSIECDFNIAVVL